MTQKDRIMRHLQVFGSITPVDAMRDYGIMRLAARISDLKEDGNIIIRTNECGVNRFGEKTRYAKYVLIAEKGEKGYRIADAT